MLMFVWAGQFILIGIGVDDMVRCALPTPVAGISRCSFDPNMRLQTQVIIVAAFDRVSAAEPSLPVVERVSKAYRRCGLSI
eukprot:SAG11_NODE_10563_length_821_cov_0.926593_1_plen_80_part_10